RSAKSLRQITLLLSVSFGAYGALLTREMNVLNDILACLIDKLSPDDMGAKTLLRARYGTELLWANFGDTKNYKTGYFQMWTGIALFLSFMAVGLMIFIVW